MKVYIAIYEWSIMYEASGQDILGVYISNALATKRCEEHEPPKNNYVDWVNYSIQEFTLDKDADNEY